VPGSAREDPSPVCAKQTNQNLFLLISRNTVAGQVQLPPGVRSGRGVAKGRDFNPDLLFFFRGHVSRKTKREVFKVGFFCRSKKKKVAPSLSFTRSRARTAPFGRRTDGSDIVSSAALSLRMCTGTRSMAHGPARRRSGSVCNKPPTHTAAGGGRRGSPFGRPGWSSFSPVQREWTVLRPVHAQRIWTARQHTARQQRTATRFGEPAAVPAAAGSVPPTRSQVVPDDWP